ncbi:MAG: hypothetical protein LBM65_04870 [Oscillospiraceae bacterium]|nr:hypothetical protein [Oscillospiraceae bacterium]
MNEIDNNKLNELFDITKRVVAENNIIGNHIFSDEEAEDLIDVASGRLNELRNLPIIKADIEYAELMFCAIVHIAKGFKSDLSDNDDGFWGFVFKTLSCDGYFNQANFFGYKYFIEIIRYLCESHKIICAIKGKKFYATVMMHALAPKLAINSFFDLCYNIFSKDLDFAYNNDQDIILRSVRTLESKFTELPSENEPVRIGSKAYNLRIGLRKLSVREDLHPILEKLFDDALTAIDNAYYNNDAFTVKDYFTQLLNEWWKSKLRSGHIVSSRKKNPHFKAVLQKDIYAFYQCDDDGNINLVLPPIILEDSTTNPKIEVFIDDTQLLKEELWTKQGEIRTNTKSWEKRLNEILPKQVSKINLRILVTQSDNVLYDSYESLYREYILFLKNLETKKLQLIPGNYIIYTLEIGNLNIPDGLSTHTKNTYNLRASEEDTIISCDRIVYFLSEDARSSSRAYITGAMIFATYMTEQNEYPVYNGEPYLLLSNIEDENAYEVWLNGKRKLLSNLKSELFDNYKRYRLTEFLEKNALNNFLIKSNVTNKPLLDLQFFYSPFLEIQFDSRWYYGDKNGSCTVFTDKSGQTLVVAVSALNRTVSFEVFNGRLIIDVPRLSWRIDNNDWNYAPQSTPLFYRTAMVNSSSLELDIPKGINLNCYATSNLKTELLNKGNFYELGKEIYTSSHIDNDIIVFAKIDGENIELCNIAMKEQFTAPPIQYDVSQQQLFFTARNFIGDTEGKIVIDFEGYKKIEMDSPPLESFIISGLKESVYPCKIYRPSNGFTPAKTIWSGDVVVGQKEKFLFKGKLLHILSVNLGWGSDSDDVLKWLVPRFEYYIDRITGVYDEKDEQWYYIGKLYVYDYRGEKRYLNAQKNSREEYETINPVRLEFRTKNSFWLVAGYKYGSEFLGELMFEEESGRISNNDRIGKTINLYRCEVMNNV